MQHILVLGAGKIGSLIATLLGEAQYKVTLADANPEAARALMAAQNHPPLEVMMLDAQDARVLRQFVEKHNIQVVVSSLPYFCNVKVAEVAKQCGLHYFDLTEDVEVTTFIKELSEDAKTAFVPQCGLAPGFIGIVTHDLMRRFDSVDMVKMRVGALPQNPSNALKYSLTWSTDGLINEYGNVCYGLENGAKTTLQPLEGYETISIDGVVYEAFNTSGGIGSLADAYEGKVRQMTYKTIRYPGHCEKIHFLMNDLKLNQNRDILKTIFENAIPQTMQDVVLIYTSVVGHRGGRVFEETFVRKVYPHTISGALWSAIQVTTAAGVCAVLDLVLHDAKKYQGFVSQENIALDAILKNRFGQYYEKVHRN